MLGAGVAAAPPGRGRWLALAGTWTLAELRAVDLALRRRAARQPRHRPGRRPARAGAARRAAACCWCWSPCWSARPSPRPPVRALACRPPGSLALVAARGAAARWLAPQGHAVGTAEVALVQGGGEQGTRKTDTSVVEVFERHVDATDARRHRRSTSSCGPRTSSTPTARLRGRPVGRRGGRPGRGPRRADDRRHGGGRRPRRTSATRPCSSTPTARSSSATTRSTACRSASTCRSASLLEPLAGDALPDRDAAHRRASPPYLDVPGPVGRVADPDLVGDLLPRPHPGGRRGRRAARAQPDQRRLVHGHDRADPAGGVVPDAGHRDGPVGRPGRARPASPRSSTTTATSSSAASIGEQVVIQRPLELREGLTLYTRLGNLLGRVAGRSC